MEARLNATIQIPAALHGYADGQSEVRVVGATVGEAIQSLTGRYPRLRRHLCGETGSLRAYVNVYLNGDDVRELAGEQTPVHDGDTITVLPSIAGG